MRKIVIKTNEQLQNCIAKGIDVEIWIGNEIDTICKLNDFTTTSIIAFEGWYLRDNCQLITRQNYFQSCIKF